MTVPNPPHRRWFRALLLVALAYVVIGVGFAALPGPDQVRLWRPAAWLASAAVAAAHLWYELFRMNDSPRTTALHAAGAVALGAFGLALAAIVHSLRSPVPWQRSLLVALIAWPAITAVPAFLLALAAASVGVRLSRRG